MILLAAAILGALYFFGQWREAQGVSAERGRWERRESALRAQAEANAAQAAEQHQRAITRLRADLRSAQQALEDVPHEAPALDFLHAWAAADAGLCDGRCAGPGGGG